MLKKFLSITLALVMILSVIMLAPITVKATTTCTLAEALSWCESQKGKAIDLDGWYGAQCADFVNAYYNYIIGYHSFVSGNANNYLNCIPSGFSYVNSPQPGDIGVSTSGEYGHVWVVGYDGYVYQQNYRGQYVTKDVASDTVNKYTPAAGYIRPNWKSSDATVSIEKWNSSGYTGIWDTRASLGIHINVSNGQLTKVGMTFWNSKNQVVKTVMFEASVSPKNRNYYFETDIDFLYSCLPSTTYYYQGIAIVNNKEYYGEKWSFTTAKCTHKNSKTYPAEKSTCFRAGHNEYTYCGDCNKVIKGSDAPLALAEHTGGKATCYKKAKCTVCGKEYGNYYHKNTEIRNAVPLVCGNKGYSGDTYCKDCNKLLKKGYYIYNLYSTHTGGKATCTKKAKCTVCGEEYGNLKAHTYKTTTTKATLTKNGKITYKCVCGATKTSTTIYYPKTIKLSATTYKYDGKVKEPTVTVKDSKGKTIASSNYTVKYSNNKDIGTAKAIITFKGNYSGTKNLTFKIIPKNPTVTVKSAKKKATISYKKISGGVKYQIQYSAKKSSGFKNVKPNTTALKVTKSGLKKGKTYYFRVRAYKKVGKTTYYSGWVTKSAKIK